ncbi:MAG: peptidoglycan DD-metalloendopeptidase family protein [Micavibrio aeruginosavorus]|nr:peptidoglycan DD-metalloendopeptidase family protein [Micavibrio aeruginosavorus]
MPQCIHLRHRHVLTRRDTVRLRFLVLPGASFAAVTLLAVNFLSPVLAMPSSRLDMASAEPVILGPAPVEMAEAGDGDKSLLDRLNISQKRMKRSMEDAAEAERLAMLDPAAGTGADRLDDQPTPQKPEGPQEKTVKIGTGDTLTGVLTKAGLSGNEAYNVVQAVKKHMDLRNLKPGQVLNIKFDPVSNEDQGGYQFAAMNMALDPLRSVSVARSDSGEGYEANLKERPTHKQLYVKEAPIEVSVFGSAAKAGIPQTVVADAIRIYSWHVDFQRDIRQGDKLQVMYEQYETDEGVRIKTGNVVYAKLTVSGVEIPIYRYEMKDGRVDYFLNNGRSIRKTLMKTPIDGARMSSGFGMRRHPIQGYNKMHKGVDFAASSGTPIYAAGDGIIEKAGRQGGYGNYVRIRHNSQLKTAYAHMSRFAKGMAAGRRVRQGEVIGYVGTTGASTGPHLHYEVLVNGAQVNPRGVNLPIGEILEGEQLRVFQAHARDIDRAFSGQQRSVKLAQRQSAPSAVAVR